MYKLKIRKRIRFNDIKLKLDSEICPEMEASIPDEETPGWKYLDIYLFSNGQENSPPRKYHLVSDHLDLWSETLKELAQEQFGSPDINISLYTTQGRLVKTPLELNHNKAYVAVKSPEEFLDAGYDRYLLKATRSWEKRQDKRSINTAEKPGEETMTGRSDPESIGALKTIVPSTADNLGSIIVNPRDRNIGSSNKPLDRSERNSTKRSSLSKRNYNALSPVKLTKTTTQRREMNMRNDETADESTPSKSPVRGRVHNVFQKRRNSEAVLSKVEEVVNQLENSSPRNVEQTNAKTKRDEIRSRILMTKAVENEKDQQNKPKTVPQLIGNRPRILMTKPVENEKDQQRSKFKPFSNSTENRNRTAINLGENVKIEQNKPRIMPHLNEHQLATKVVEEHIKENNQTLGETVNRNENVTSPLNISNNNRSNQQNFNNELIPPVLPTEKKQKPRDKSDNDSKAESSLNTLNKNKDDPLKKKETLSPPATSTMTNPLSNLNKGIINMRIEVWNSSEVTRNASCEIKAPVIILTNEIGSQVDMAGQTGQNKGLHQVIASDKDGNYKVILVKSSYPNNDACETSKHSVIGECVMFLPVIKLGELYCRCSGGETNDMNALGTNSSVINPVKKVASCLSVHKENANRISMVTDIHHEEMRPEFTELNDRIQDKTEPSWQKLSANDKQFNESTKTLQNSPSKLVESVKTSKGHISNRNSETTNLLPKHEVPPKDTLDSKENEREREYTMSQPDYREPVDSKEQKSKQNPEVPPKDTLDSKENERNKEYSVSQPDYREPVDSKEQKSKQIEMLATQPEAKESVISKISKYSESQIPKASDLEKDKETKAEEAVEIIHSIIEDLNIIAPELSPNHAKSDGLSKCPSATSEVSKITSIRETEEYTLQYNNEKLTKASAVSEATSLLETTLDLAKPQALTQNKATQTEWTDMLWEAQLQQDGHYSFHLPALSRLKEYNL